MSEARKTLLLLGGSAAQVVAIDRARELGYRTVLCDYLPDNPGQRHADSFHLVSTTDKEAVLRVAREEGADGVVAYGSDPAAPTAAYVARELGLPGVPYGVARAFCEKQLFRGWLAEHGFDVPASMEVAAGGSPDAGRLAAMRYPLIVKPTDSSGSKGVTVVEGPDGLGDALEYASRYSRNGTLIVEEFVRRDHPQVIEAEIFAVGGEVASWGLMNSIRDGETNPLLPAAYSYPLELPEGRERLVREQVSKLVGACGSVSGAFNIEMVIDASERLFFLDAGPRNGGNELPLFMSMVSGKDVVAATLMAAMGETEALDVALDGRSGGFWGLGVLHSARAGRLAGMDYSPAARRALVREEVQLPLGAEVRPFERCDDLVGLSFFRFDGREDMDDVMWHMNDNVRVVLDGC